MTKKKSDLYQTLDWLKWMTIKNKDLYDSLDSKSQKMIKMLYVFDTVDQCIFCKKNNDSTIADDILYCQDHIETQKIILFLCNYAKEYGIINADSYINAWYKYLNLKETDSNEIIQYYIDLTKNYKELSLVISHKSNELLTRINKEIGI